MSAQFRATVPAELDGIRFDRCVAELHEQWSRAHVRRLIDAGAVRLNGAPTRPSTVVRAGDLVEGEEPPPEPSELVAEEIPLRILFEDDDLIVVDKPPGLVIHPAAGNPRGTLVNALLHHRTDLPGIGGVERPGIVHRLDKDTSGVMVVAATSHAHQALSLAFRRREVEKTYLAVVYGDPDRNDLVVDAPVGRHRGDRKRMAVTADGRPARTLVRVEERLSGLVLAACRPVTGRTHQIRVHMAHVGHALVGDPLYAGRQWKELADPRRRAACRSFPRQALHAWRLTFTHPTRGERVTFEAPVPDDLRGLLELLRRVS